jgi:NADH-quinone oxidoreductase subunit A
MGGMMEYAALPILFFLAVVVGLGLVLLGLARATSARRPGRVKRMPYESGMDPVHDTRRRFDVRFHLLAIAFLVFDVELLFLYPWAVVVHPRYGGAAMSVFVGGMVFVVLLALGFLYDWRKGVFRWR